MKTMFFTDFLYSYGNALTASANDGNIEIMELLLEKGAIIDHPAGWPLQAAAKRGHGNVIEKLLAQGANVNALTSSEHFPQGTALHAACEFGRVEVVRMLLEHGANPDLGPNDSTCPLIAATLNGDENVTRLLLDKKSEVNVHGGKYNATPLINAASWLSIEFVELILQAGANIDDEDEDGDTALISAARRGDADSIKILLNHGADFMHTNHSGQNALQVAILNSNANEDCAKILIDTMSEILLSIKMAMNAGNEAVASVVQAANSERLEKAKAMDVTSQAVPDRDDIEIKAENGESQLPISEKSQSIPPPNEAEHSNAIDGTSQSQQYSSTDNSDRQQRYPDQSGSNREGSANGPDGTLGVSEGQQAEPLLQEPQSLDQQRPYRSDGLADITANEQQFVTRRPVPVAPQIPSSFDNRNGQSSVLSAISSDYKAENSPAQPQPASGLSPNTDPSPYSRNEATGPYSLPPSTAQQSQTAYMSNDWQQSQYNNQSQQATMHGNLPYDSSNYQASNNSNQWGANNAYSQGAPPYQSHNSGQEPYQPYHYNQGGSDQWQQQQQQQPMRPGSEERQSSSSSLFGPNMRDSFEKAKQFGLNRWRS